MQHAYDEGEASASLKTQRAAEGILPLSMCALQASQHTRVEVVDGGDGACGGRRGSVSMPHIAGSIAGVHGQLKGGGPSHIPVLCQGCT